MTGLEERPETARGRAVYELLLAVHAGIRRDLERVEGLAAKAADGLPPEELQQELHELRRDSFLWRLRVDCLRYCGFVHAHHNAEDHAFFPELRATNPEIGPVVDRLEADHRRVSDLLDAVEAAANALSEGGTADTRRELVDVLHALGENLLEHLNYEELNVKSTVLRLREGSVI
jgi:hypothetical protein